MSSSDIAVSVPGLIALEHNCFDRTLAQLRSQIGNYSLHRLILQWRARKHGGQFPMRMWNILKRVSRASRPYFRGRTAVGTRYLGDFRQVYPVVQLTDPKFQTGFAQWVIEHLQKHAGAYVDVGANIGILASTVAAAMPDRAVIAFEPMPATVAQAAAAFALNGLTNVRLYQAAVGDFDGKIAFASPAGGSDRASVHADILEAGSQLDKVNVQCVRLDRLLDEGQLPQVGLIKIDVEGHEPAALRGMLGLLRRDKPVVVFEYATSIAPKLGWTVEGLAELLRGVGYAHFNVLGDDGDLLNFPPSPDAGGIFNIVCR